MFKNIPKHIKLFETLHFLMQFRIFKIDFENVKTDFNNFIITLKHNKKKKFKSVINKLHTNVNRVIKSMLTKI